MRYEGQIFRPPSEAESFILQATIGCSWNHCTYCDMYRNKTYRVRPIEDAIRDIEEAATRYGEYIEKVFVSDGDALAMKTNHWIKILNTCQNAFPKLRQISSYATAINILEKDDSELKALRDAGLSLLYIGPETGDNTVFKEIAKGANYADHVQAAQRAHRSNIRLSTIFLLGAGGTTRSDEHAMASAKLISEMDPHYLSLLTLTLIPKTPIAKRAEKGQFELPDIYGLLREIYTIIEHAKPTNSVFRTNHASNYLPLSGQLPKDRERLLLLLDQALSGKISLRPEWARGL